MSTPNEVIQKDELEFERPLEEDEELLTDAKKIYCDNKDREITSLYDSYKKNKLILQPDFQRGFVWDKKKASRLIESSLLGIPIPMVYLSEENDGKIQVIDGQQRLTAFFSFIDGRFPDDSSFELTGLTSFDLNKKKYGDLPDPIKDKIMAYSIRTILFKKESDPKLKFEIFERLNMGSVSLNDQELRNCIYRGKYNDLLIDLSENKEFRQLLGLKTSEKRMRDVELVLRFSAFYHSTYLKYKPTMKIFLNEEMEKYRNISEKDADELRKAFKNTVSIIKSLLDNHAFKRYYPGDSNNPKGKWELKKFNASLYDILMYTFAKEDRNKVQQNLDSIREGLIQLMITDQQFIDSIELSTSSIKAVRIRFDKWRLLLQDIIGVEQKEPRCFSFEMKEEMIKNNSICGICGQQITNVDDAAIDHIKQYWMGGKTIPENARLAHRYCNWSRPRKE